MKSVLITGASGGMGYATAVNLIKEGCIVYGLDLKPPAEDAVLLSSPESAEQSSNFIQTNSTGPQEQPSQFVQTNNAGPQEQPFHFIQADLTDPASVEQAFRTVSHLTKELDAIIHMAGIYDLDSLAEISEEAFTKIFQVNLFAAYRVNKLFLPLLKKGGRILITTSELAPLDPLPFTGIYAVTKAALDKYAYSLRMELQLLDRHVIVLRPGAVKTGLLDDSLKAMDDFCADTKLYSYSSEKFRNIIDRVESRNISPEQLAGTVYKALTAKHPKPVYNINRNPLLLLMNCLPDRLQLKLIRLLLKQ